MELVGLCKDGTRKDLEITVQDLNTPEGRRFVIVLRDISLRKRAEQALRESEERFRLLVENSPTGIYMVGNTPNLTYANQRLADMVGYRVEELVTSPFTRFIADEEMTRLVDYYERRRRGEPAPYQLEFQGLRKDGQKRTFELHVTMGPPINGQTITWGQVLDITERK
jgi:PAS domain S-box-containing protein